MTSLPTIENITEGLKKILEDAKVCQSHGVDHALTVYSHAQKALECHEGELTDERKKQVLLASLMHDLDDPKLFIDHKNNENTRKLLSDYLDKYIEQVIEMIDLVSCSKNGDRVGDGVTEEMLIARYSDRLEALGVPGIVRCYQYTMTVGRPLYTEKTLRAKDEDDLWNRVATDDEYRKYSTPREDGKRADSETMIDHYYQKLLHLHKFPVKNKYLLETARSRVQPLVDVVLLFGKQGFITKENLDEIVKRYS